MRIDKSLFIKSILFMLLLSLTVQFGFCQDKEEAEKTPAQQLEALLGEDITGEIPSNVNGIDLTNTPGYEEALKLLKKAKDLKIEGRVYLTLHDYVNGRLNEVKNYGEESENDLPVKNIFREGFKPVSADELLAKIVPPLEESEKAKAKALMEERIKILNLARFEKETADFGEISTKRLRIFYDNAHQKMLTAFEDVTRKVNKTREDLDKSINNLYRHNIKFDFRIGSESTYKGIKKNFAPSDEIIINVLYSTEGIKEEIPFKWELKSPKGMIKTDKGILFAGKGSEILKLYEGTIAEKAPSGKYTLNVVLFPDDKDKRKYSEYFIVGGLPFQISQVFILSMNKKPKSTFTPGEIALFVVRYHPFNTKIEKGSFTFRVFDPSGSEVPNLTTTKTLKFISSEKKIQTKGIKGLIPKKAKTGTYTYQVVINADKHKEMSDVIKFSVIAGIDVDIVASATKVKKGEKVTFKPKIMGGRAPYKFLWKTDTGIESPRETIAMKFNNKGKRWLTLTVTDSSKPEAKSGTARIEVEVTE